MPPAGASQAALAQIDFVDQLHRSGMLDEREHASFSSIVEKLLRHLARKGAVWHVPRPREVRAALALLGKEWGRRLWDCEAR